MFEKLGVQLYTIRDYMKDEEFADVAFAKLAKAGYTEAQTAGAFGNDERFAPLFAKHGITVVGTHYSYDKIISEPEKTAALHTMLGTTNIGIGGMPKEARDTLDGLKTFIRNYNAAAEQYAKEGFKLTYHNHNFEFLRIDGTKTLMDILYEELDPKNVSFVLDTCWVAAAGADVVDWMEKLAGRIDILHLKDMCLKKDAATGKLLPEVAEVGNGNLSWDKIMDTAERIGVKHYVVEQDGSWAGTPFNSLQMSAEFLAKYKK